jgi:hypothetical protein
MVARGPAGSLLASGEVRGFGRDLESGRVEWGGFGVEQCRRHQLRVGSGGLGGGGDRLLALAVGGEEKNDPDNNRRDKDSDQEDFDVEAALCFVRI